MRKPTLALFYQYNPWNCSIGGIQTLMNSFIKCAPSEFDLRLVGTGYDSKQAAGQWHSESFDGRKLSFMPLFYLPDDNVRRLVPTSVRYTAALRKHDLSADFMHFYRLEYALATSSWQGEKTLFIQNDIRQQVLLNQDKSAILWQKFPQLYFSLERRMLGQFDQILSCNANSTAFYQEQYPTIANRVHAFSNTVDPEKFYPLTPADREQRRQQLAQELGLPTRTKFILFAGRLHPQKDPLLLLNAIAELQTQLQNTDAHLLVAGAGELDGAMRQEIDRLGIGQRVTMLGAVPAARIAQIDQIASVFVLSSAYEGLPFAALEVLASGTPIVTTRCGDTPKLLSENNGVICEERTPIALAQALNQILSHPECYPASACVAAAQPYSAQVVLGQVFEDMLERWASSRGSGVTAPAPQPRLAVASLP